jgi:hypothetical protein
MEMSKGKWNLKSIFIKFLGFVAYFFLELGVEFEIWQIGAPCN